VIYAGSISVFSLLLVVGLGLVSPSAEVCVSDVHTNNPTLLCWD